MKHTIIFLAFLFVYVVAHHYDDIEEDDDDESIPDDLAFENFMTKYGIKYDNAEKKNKRKLIFAKNRKLINAHKKDHKNGKVGYNLRLNKFADYTAEEFNQNFKGLVVNRPIRNNVPYKSEISRVRRELPTSLDYRDKNAVVGAVEQGLCGGCYSFAAIAAIESQVALKIGGLNKLSEQQTLDCSSAFKNDGCNGGAPQQVFQYLIKAGGVATNDAYPYKSGVTNKTGSCVYSPTQNSKAIVTDYIDVAVGEINLQNALFNIGPIAVSIDSSKDDFQFLSYGVFYDPTCGSNDKLDHAVVVIGYGTDPKEGDFWIIKNSWGTTWGTNGFAKMARNKNNNCGIASSASYPTIKYP